MTRSSTMALCVAVSAVIPSVAIAQTEAMKPGTSVDVPVGRMEVGGAPADFDFWRTGKGGPGKWVVVTAAAATGGKAIAQQSTDSTSYRFPLAIYKPVTVGNGDVTVRFKAVAGKVDQAAGIAMRLRTPDDYYVVRANALENNVRFYRVVKGNREQIAGSDIKVSSGDWHTLGLRAEGDRFSISFDGKELFTARDETLVEPGKVALWTKADSVTEFDQMTIKAIE
jgi:hypothetical protein